MKAMKKRMWIVWIVAAAFAPVVPGGSGVVALCFGGDGSFDVTRVVFQIPVATKQRVAGQVRACRDVGTGQASQAIDQCAAGVSLGHITAVNHQIRVRCQRVAPQRYLLSVLFQRLRVEHVLPERK